jgi:hypothetical protein
MIKCTLKFSDGKQVSGRVLEDFGDGRLHPITYEGAVDRLHLMPKTGTAKELTFLFLRIAAMATAIFNVSRTSC